MAATHHLEFDAPRPIAPDPDIRGFMFPAYYSHYLQGRIRGVPVVAFDYAIGWGRGRKVGSCVGVQRRDLRATPPRRGLTLTHEGDWTFFYTSYPLLLNGRRMWADRVEELWNALLNAPGEPTEASPAPAEVPGGIVIRPRRLRKD